MMTRKEHYDAIAHIIGNEMALGVNLIPEEDDEWQYRRKRAVIDRAYSSLRQGREVWVLHGRA